MKLIEPSAEYIPQEDIYKHIELCARTCYKSEDRITEDSAHKFVDGLIKAGHGAMLEHGTIYLFYSGCCYDHEDMGFASKYENNPYTRGGFIGTDDNEISSDGNFYDIMGNHATGNMQFCFTTNLRVLVENNWLDDLQYAVTPFDNRWPKRYTMKFITSVGICRELLRHRKFSFANESTRYCRYDKDRFGNHVTFILPSWCTDVKISDGGTVVVDAESGADYEFIHGLANAEQTYFELLREGWKAEQARDVLPLATKTELIMTGFEDDWEYFFDIRLRETTGKVHPDMKVLAQLLWNEFKDKLNLEL